MEKESSDLSILMFPWLAHGHIFPFLELAKALLTRKQRLRIYLCSTAINFDSIKSFVDKNQLSNSLQLVEVHLQTTELPPHYHTTKNLPPHLNFALLKAIQTANSSFSDIVGTFKPNLVIYDVFHPWASKVAAKQGIPAVYFSIYGALFLAYRHHQFTHGYDPSAEFPFPVGPLITYDPKNATDGDSDETIRWLSRQPPNSTVFVSFGSEYFLSEEEIGEIAKGLDLSGANFIWIIRFPQDHRRSTALEDVLPPGFLGGVDGRGLVVTGWAPQADILAHPSTAGFVTHCGWSSIVESMYFGVPVVAMPMKLDQPINARMLSAAGSCVEVSRHGGDEAFNGEEIAEAIKKVVSEEIGGGLKIRAKELSEAMKMEKEEALDDAAEQLWKLCVQNN